MDTFGPIDARTVRTWTVRGITITLNREFGPLRWNASRDGWGVGGARTPWGAVGALLRWERARAKQ